MIHDLKPYSVYKDSGVIWLGQVPEHWIELRIKNLFREKDERSGDGNGILLSLTRARGIIPQTEASNRIASAEDLSKYKICRPGDLIMNRMQAWSGMFAVSSYNGLVSPDYSVFAAIGKLNVKYFEHLFKTPVLVEQFAQRSKGIGSGFNRLYTPDFGAVPLVIPPLLEQSAIVRYLDYIDRCIRHYIRAKQKLIRLLEEQKQAIIHQAVTRGLDPNVKLKPSSVEWFGDLPENWEVMRCGRLFKEIVDTGYPELELLSIDRFQGIIPQSETGRKMRASEDRSKYKRVRPGELAYNLMNAFMGSIGVSTLDGVLSPAYAVARPLCEMEPVYFHHLFRTRLFTTQFDRYSYGIMYERNRLYFERFKQIPAVVPLLDEQKKIVEYISRETEYVDLGIKHVLSEISLLREYRTRLIADVVTGKLDVREAAVNLPEETDEAESFDDVLAEDDELESNEVENEQAGELEDEVLA